MTNTFMNPNLDLLHAYPFEKLAKLKNGITPPDKLDHIALSIGEPKHTPPPFVLDQLQSKIALVGKYAATSGLAEFRMTVANWAKERFNLAENTLTAEKHILPVNGTREALFAIAQACIDNTAGKKPVVLMPNPFYQIYEGAALLAGAKAEFINCDTENLHPDFSSVAEETWKNCQLLYLCSPGNPTGAVLELKDYEYLLELSDKYGFIIASDECYSELYFDENQPPLGLLQACAELGRHNFKSCVVFHSLSKRSNLPGLRSGFVAGDANIIEKFYQYRTYHGCAMSLPIQYASIAAWSNELHVKQNREFYREKFDTVIDILQPHIEINKPEAGFYLWLKTPGSDVEFARELYAQQNITVLPGSFLARDTPAGNPGKNRVRIALVASVDECREAAERIKTFLQNNR